MEFIGIIGERGSGKTNIMTKYLHDAMRDGDKVISNYSLKFKHRIMSFEELRQLGPEIQDCVIGMDELGVGADSYDFFSKESRKITSLIAQIRKRHCRVYYTVQRFSMVARRLRLQTDGFIFMEDIDRGNMRTADGLRVKTHREVCSGFFRAMYCNDDLEVMRTRIFDGHKYWGIYDTDEIIWG